MASVRKANIKTRLSNLPFTLYESRDTERGVLHEISLSHIDSVSALTRQARENQRLKRRLTQISHR